MSPINQISHYIDWYKSLPISVSHLIAIQYFSSVSLSYDTVFEKEKPLNKEDMITAIYSYRLTTQKFLQFITKLKKSNMEDHIVLTIVKLKMITTTMFLDYEKKLHSVQTSKIPEKSLPTNELRTIKRSWNRYLNINSRVEPSGEAPPFPS